MLFSFLKNHPFAVEAFFETSLVLTYAAPKEELQSLIPQPLQLDTVRDQWAFVAVAIVKTKGLRPKGFPAFTGNDFILIGYRIFVRYTTSAGKRLRGLYILKSETDKKKMEVFGNLFTHYRYTTTDVAVNRTPDAISVRSVKSGLAFDVKTHDDASLPPRSPFADWKEARRFAGPLPFTFMFKAATNEMLLIEGMREDWNPKPVAVREASVDFIKKLNLKGVVLANAFLVENIPYHWKKGKKDTWKP